MATLLPTPKARFFDSNGDPLNGGKVYTYEAGTTTAKDTYTTSTGAVANANPVILDANGYADIWLGDGAYKIVLKTSADVTVFTVDNIIGEAISAFGGAVFDISSTTTITDTHANSIIAATGTITLNLTSAATLLEGFVVSVRNSGAGVTTIDPSAAETINGSATVTLNPGESILLVSNGTNWVGMFYMALASQSEAEAGTVSTVVMTPQRTSQAITALAPKVGVPQNSQSAAYELVLTDQGKHLLHPSADTTARIFTIPANSSVAFPVGTIITLVNQNGGGVITIAITTDTMRLAGAGTTGSRTLAANGIATLLKITTTEWIISGVGLT